MIASANVKTVRTNSMPFVAIYNNGFERTEVRVFPATYQADSEIALVKVIARDGTGRQFQADCFYLTTPYGRSIEFVRGYRKTGL